MSGPMMKQQLAERHLADLRALAWEIVLFYHAAHTGEGYITRLSDCQDESCRRFQKKLKVYQSCPDHEQGGKLTLEHLYQAATAPALEPLHVYAIHPDQARRMGLAE